jgi:hypothetical protein
MKKILIVLSFATALLLISSVSAVPNIKAPASQEVDLSKLKKIEERFIEERGIEEYNETVFKIKHAIYSGRLPVMYSANYETNTIGFTEELPLHLSVNGLTQLIVYLMLFILLVFGHNELGYTLAVGISALILLIPCFTVALIGGLPYSSGMVLMLMDAFDINPMEILYDHGAIGLLLVMCIIFPVALILIIIAYPLAVGLMTIELLYLYINTALEIVENW